jgi:hypothetical protein
VWTALLAVEPALQVVVAAKRMSAMPGRAKHIPCLLGEGAYGGSRRNKPSARGLASDAAHGATGDRGHSFQQVPRPRLAVQHPGDLPDVLRQVG